MSTQASMVIDALEDGFEVRAYDTGKHPSIFVSNERLSTVSVSFKGTPAQLRDLGEAIIREAVRMSAAIKELDAK